MNRERKGFIGRNKRQGRCMALVAVYFHQHLQQHMLTRYMGSGTQMQRQTCASICWSMHSVRGGGRRISSHSTSNTDSPALCTIAALPRQIQHGDSSEPSLPSSYRFSWEFTMAARTRFRILFTCKAHKDAIQHVQPWFAYSNTRSII